ncbi:unnamed protein product, partial [Acidithrix sp. C25]
VLASSLTNSKLNISKLNEMREPHLAAVPTQRVSAVIIVLEAKQTTTPTDDLRYRHLKHLRRQVGPRETIW